MLPPPPLIKVLSYMHGDLQYFQYSEAIHRLYCKRHGYNYVIRKDTPRLERNVVWHKIQMIVEELKDCDYLLFIDADAVFYSHELKIEDEIIEPLGDKTILMAADVSGEDHRERPDLPNSGVILIRNTDLARQIMSEWCIIPLHDPETATLWPPTQTALWRHIMPKYSEHIEVMKDYYRINGKWGQYIRHFVGFQGGDRSRVPKIKAIYDRLTNE